MNPPLHLQLHRHTACFVGLLGHDAVIIDSSSPRPSTSAGRWFGVRHFGERTSRYTFLCHLPQKDATSVRAAFTRKLEVLPAPLLKSLTYPPRAGIRHPGSSQDAVRIASGL